MRHLSGFVVVLAFSGPPGFDPVPILQASRVPALWLLGDHDQSVPTFASARILDSLRASGNDRHTVVRYPNADHALRDVASGEPVPVWEQVTSWLEPLGIPGQRR